MYICMYVSMYILYTYSYITHIHTYIFIYMYVSALLGQQLLLIYVNHLYKGTTTMSSLRFHKLCPSNNCHEVS